MNDKNKKDETLRPMLNEIENTDIATLKKHKAKVAIPLRIWNYICGIYDCNRNYAIYAADADSFRCIMDCRGNVYYNCAHHSILCKT